MSGYQAGSISPTEIEILRTFIGSEDFTEHELKELSEGTASFKVMSNAQKKLDKFKTHMRQNISRAELNSICGQIFQEIDQLKGFLMSLNGVLASVELLKERCCVTQEEVEEKLQVMFERLKTENPHN